jgi:hypothetical protein
MTWSAGTPLIADLDELRTLLGPHAFENLETASPALDLMDYVTRASDEVRASIKGVDPAKIVNTDDYKPAVAAHVHAQLVMHGFLAPREGQGVPVSPFEWSDPRMARVEPRLSSGDRPTGIGSAFPKVRNVNCRFF